MSRFLRFWQVFALVTALLSLAALALVKSPVFYMGFVIEACCFVYFCGEIRYESRPNNQTEITQ